MAYACLQWQGYEPAAHHHLIAARLERIARGESNRLIIQMPPRSGKSLIVSQYFPAWFLGNHPDKRIACASYGQELASDFGRTVRNQFADPLFQRLFPGVRLSEDSAAADKFDLAPPHRGGYVAVGVGGALTGRGAHCFARGTLVRTQHGSKPIESLIEAADEPVEILSWNADQQRLEYRPVDAYQIRQRLGVFRLLTDGGRRLTVTGDHRIYVEGKGYVAARHVQIGDRLMSLKATGTSGHETFEPARDYVQMVYYVHELTDVYDVQVSANHNLFAEDLLCHNCLLIDDPVKGREDADSAATQRRLRDWYTSVAYTRLMDDGAIVLCMTRWTTDDLAGWLLKEHRHEGWEVITLPAINDRKEALWPERFPLPVLEKIRKTLPARDWEALYQQRPFLEEGNIYKRAWWQAWPSEKPLPDCEFILQSWDTAFSDADRKHSSYSACVTLGIFKRPDDACHQAILLNAWKERMDYPDLRKAIQRMYQDHRPDKVLIEKKASGQSILQDLRHTNVPITAYVPDRDKIARAYAAQSLLENGRLYYPDRRWAEDFISALARFPNPEDNDLADAFSQAIIWLQNHMLLAHDSDARRRALEDQTDDEDDADELLPSNVRRLKLKRKRAAYG